MNIRDLEYLIALAKHRHFQRAAEACNVSQSTLSTQLRKLEAELGLLLIERTTRKVNFTKTGLRLVEQTKVVLREIDELKNMASNNHQSLMTTLNIGIVPTLAPYLLPHIMALVSDYFPETELEIYEMPHAQLLEMLESNKIEFAIISRERDYGRFSTINIFSEPFVLGVGRQHPYKDIDTINMATLKNNKLLMLDEFNGLHEPIQKYCQQFEVEQDRRFVATYLETLRRCVSCNKGIALFPLLSTLEKNSGDIHYISCVNPVPVRHVTLLYRAGDSMRKNYELLSRELSGKINKYIESCSSVVNIQASDR